MSHFLPWALIGVGTGFLGGLFGISGGVIAVPILGFLGLTEQLAQGTSLFMQLPIGIVAVWQYLRRNRFSSHFALTLAAATMPFAFAGSLLATSLPGEMLRRAFAVFIVGLATYTLWNTLRPRGKAAGVVALAPPAAAGIGAIGGVCSGLFGAGGATFAVPTFILLFGMSQTEAQGMGLVLILPTIIIALPTYWRAGDISWPIAIPLTVGAMVSVSFGVAAAHYLPQRTLRAAFCGVLYVTATALWSIV